VHIKGTDTLRLLKPYQLYGYLNKIDGIVTPFNAGYIYRITDGRVVKIMRNGDIRVMSFMAKLSRRIAFDKVGWHDTSILLKYPHFKLLFEKSRTFIAEP